MISGIADFVQVSMRYTVMQQAQIIVFHFKILNITKFLLEDLVFELEVSQNIKVKPYSQESNCFKLKSLSTRESATWSVVCKINTFTDCTCHLRISLPPNESCTALNENIVIYTRPFGISLTSMLCKNTTFSHSETTFKVCYA